MPAQRLHIVDQPITPVTGRVRWKRRLPGPAKIKQHHRAMCGQPAQVAEVGRGLHGAAGKTDQRGTPARLAICEPCAIGREVGCHLSIVFVGYPDTCTATFDEMRARATAHVPDPAGVLKDEAAFFRRGYSGAGREALSSAEVERYHARAAELAPPDL